MKVGIFIRDVDESGVSYTIYDEYRIRRIVAVGVPDTLEEKALFESDALNLRWGIMKADESTLVKKVLDKLKTMVHMPYTGLLIRDTAEGYRCGGMRPDIYLVSPDYIMPEIGGRMCTEDGVYITRTA